MNSAAHRTPGRFCCRRLEWRRYKNDWEEGPTYKSMWWSTYAASYISRFSVIWPCVRALAQGAVWFKDKSSNLWIWTIYHCLTSSSPPLYLHTWLSVVVCSKLSLSLYIHTHTRTHARTHARTHTHTHTHTQGNRDTHTHALPGSSPPHPGPRRPTQ